MSRMSSDLPLHQQTPGGADQVDSARERICSAALRLFCERGYEASSVREIVEAAGVTKPVLYYYFKNKDDLFREIICSNLERFQDRLREACEESGEDFASKLKRIHVVYIDIAHSRPLEVKFINAIAFSGLYEEIVPFTEYWVSNLELIGNVFEQAAKDGALRGDVQPLAMAYHFMGVCLSTMRQIVYCPMDEKERLGEFDPVELVLAGVLPRPDENDAQ